MVILLRSVTTGVRMLFWHISYCKVQQSNFVTKCDRLLLQSQSDITKCDRSLLQNVSGITKCDRLYYKVRQVLQCVTVITKWDLTTAILNTTDISRRRSKLNFRLFRGHVKSGHFPERMEARRLFFYILYKFLGRIGRTRLG